MTYRRVLSSVEEIETADILHNCQNAVDTRNMLEILDHPQAATPVKTDNSTATTFVNNDIKKQKSKP